MNTQYQFTKGHGGVSTDGIQRLGQLPPPPDHLDLFSGYVVDLNGHPLKAIVRQGDRMEWTDDGGHYTMALDDSKPVEVESMGHIADEWTLQDHPDWPFEAVTDQHGVTAKRVSFQLAAEPAAKKSGIGAALAALGVGAYMSWGT